MPSVRCPSCDTAQHVEVGSTGYTCSSCGKEWGFVVCRSCGSRFHAKPDATSWTCPRCGLLQDASAEPAPPAPPETAAQAPMKITDSVLDQPQEPLGSAFPPGLGFDDNEGPQDAFAMPVRESGARPVWIYAVAGVVALLILVVLFNLLIGGGEDPLTPGDTGAQVTSEQAIATMCGHARQVTVFRDDALGVAAEQLATDVIALEQAEEPKVAKKVGALIASIERARTAIANQQPTQGPFAKVLKAQNELPC